MSVPRDLYQVKAHFDKCIQEYGATPRGVDWNSDESQQIRFDQLLRLIREDSHSILDYGCSYGALADYLDLKGFSLDYYGFDILQSAIDLARKLHADYPGRTFFSDKAQLPVCDYVVSSGIFNYRADVSDSEWTDYILSTLHEFDKLSTKGFGSNFLTIYSDADKMRPHLYYADPLFLFDYCKRNFSRDVAILHDYELYDFTILVRK